MAQTDQHTAQHETIGVSEHPADAGLFQSAEFYVAAGFVIFVAIMLWIGVHKMIAKALDERSQKIAEQIEEARSLREEAQTDLAQRMRRQKEAASEAEAIVAQAEDDSRLLMDDANREIERLSARREELALNKIAQAEAAALKTVRAEAAAIAIKAARRVLADTLAGKKGDAMTTTAIKSIGD
jgi:F-type H+-transporting ATPase subunit b